ncbi:MAG: cytochrome P450 [Linnemannia gamsii]|nr:MAG: cytochrome P450 [Linnemannia gamsii]
MSLVMAGIGLKRLMARQMAKRKRTPLEYAALAMMGCFVAALIKYPNRAFMTKARPDLKAAGKEPSGLPLIGNLVHILLHMDDLVTFLHKCFQESGDVISITFPVFGRVIIVNRPEFIEHILKINFENYVKGDIIRGNMMDLFGRGIFVTDREEWKFHRKTASNIFTTKLYRSLVEGAFKSSAEDFSTILDRAIAADKPVDLQEKFLKLTLDAFGKLTFGLEFKALLSGSGPNEFGDAFDFLTSAADARLANPIWFITDKLIPGRWRKLQGCLRILDEHAAKAVKNRRAETPEQAATRTRDLLDHFINYKSEDGTMLTDRELRDVFVNFMIAGRDTTAQALLWQFYCLMINPRVMKNIVHEIDLVLEGSTDKITYEVLLNELPYVKAVLYETLRLHPPVSKNVKQAVDDDILPDGTCVHKGEFVGYSSWCMGRNKVVWGIDAEQYVPERWLVSSVVSPGTNSDSPITINPATGRGVSPFGKFKAESQFKFNSFNAGPRLCLGMTFALLEAMTTTCILLQRYHFKLTPGQPEPMIKGSITLPMKNELLATVNRRTDAPFHASTNNGYSSPREE